MLVANDGPDDAANLSFDVYSSLASVTNSLRAVGDQGAKVVPFTVEAGTAQLIHVEFIAPNENADTITFVLHGGTSKFAVTPTVEGTPAPIAPVTIAIAASRNLAEGVYKDMVRVSLLVAVIVILLSLFWFRRVDPRRRKAKEEAGKIADRETGGRFGIFRGVIFPASKDWSFSNNFTTNITALGAVLGIILSATGVFTHILPGLNVADLTGANLLLLAVLGLAPILFAVGSCSVELSDLRTPPASEDPKDKVPEDETGRAEAAKRVSLSGTRTWAVLLASLVVLYVIACELYLIWVLVGMSQIPGWVKVFLPRRRRSCGAAIVVYSISTLVDMRCTQPQMPAQAGAVEKARAAGVPEHYLQPPTKRIPVRII